MEHRPRESCRSAAQYALLLTIQKLLQEADQIHSKIPCYAQDPVYTDPDKIVLKESGIEVVEDPRGSLEMDDDSIVFSCAPNVPVKQIVTDIARRVILIWCRVQEDKGSHVG
jgi:hypothetical protein